MNTDIQVVGVGSDLVDKISKYRDLDKSLVYDIMKYNVLTMQQVVDITNYKEDKVNNAMRDGRLNVLSLFPCSKLRSKKRFILRDDKFNKFIEHSFTQ